MEFVDKELGYAVAIAYWFTYAVGFAALVAISASTMSYWIPHATDVVHITVYTALPFVLGAINILEIEWYGYVEVVAGVIKLFILLITIVILIAIDAKYWSHPSEAYDKDAAPGFVSALIMTIPIATFAYTGVEIIAASIIEAEWGTKPKNGQEGQSAGNAENAQNLQDDQPTQDIRNRTRRPNQGNDVEEDPNRDRKESAIATIRATAVVVPIIFVFILIWFGLKIWKMDLHLWKTLDENAVKESVEKLNGLRDKSLAPTEAATTAVNTNGSTNNRGLRGSRPRSAGNIHHRR
ncbi:hypothetical protein FPSE5266_11382 [Fusarium pseudograminearum]|nr:hypothetical protein FPSE5266_11382 [Fusarium pseudograminearum]